MPEYDAWICDEEKSFPWSWNIQVSVRIRMATCMDGVKATYQSIYYGLFIIFSNQDMTGFQSLPSGNLAIYEK